MMFDSSEPTDGADVYEIFDAIDIRLSQTNDDDEPIKVDYEMVDFDGQIAKF